MYVDACLNDIKSLYDRIDQLSKETDREAKMLAYCTEAIDLHGRIFEYYALNIKIPLIATNC